METLFPIKYAAVDPGSDGAFGEALNDIVAIRNSITPEDLAVPAGNVAFVGADRVSIGSQTLALLSSGFRSICALLDIPIYVAKKLSPATCAAVFTDLFKEKFQSRNFIQFRIASPPTPEVKDRYLRAVFINPRNVFMDREILMALSNALGQFQPVCYWVDDFIMVLRCVFPKPIIADWHGRKISVGVDVINSEVREKSLSVCMNVYIEHQDGQTPTIVGSMRTIVPPKMKTMFLTDISAINEIMRSITKNINNGTFASVFEKTMYQVDPNVTLNPAVELKYLVNKRYLAPYEASQMIGSSGWLKKPHDMFTENLDELNRKRVSWSEFCVALTQYCSTFDNFLKRQQMETFLSFMN